MPNVYFLTTVENDSILPGGANSQYYLNLMKNEITSCLNSNGISYFSENSAPKDAVGINLVIDSSSGKNPGIKISYQKANPDSNRLSTIIFENMKMVYFDPSNVRLSSEEKTVNGKLMTTISFENLQNPENLLWVRQNLELISKEIIMSLTEFFGLPYVACEETKTGMATKDESIRNRPSLNAEVIGSTQANTKIDVLGQWENWYVVGKNGDLGYIQTQFIEI